MAVMKGCDGEITFGTSNRIGYIDSFSLSMNIGTAEVSSLGKTSKDFISTVEDWSGSASGTLDVTDPAQKAFLDSFTGENVAPMSAKFKVSSNLAYKGSVLVTSMSINASHGDKVSVSFNFQGTGKLESEVVGA